MEQKRSLSEIVRTFGALIVASFGMKLLDMSTSWIHYADDEDTSEKQLYSKEIVTRH